MGCANHLEGLSAYLKSQNVEESLGCETDDAWLYHKSVKFDAYWRDFVFSLLILECGVDKIEFGIQVSVLDASKKDFCCACVGTDIYHWDDNVHMIYT